MLIYSIYLQSFKCVEHNGDSNLPLIFFFAKILLKSFSPIPVFDPIFSFLVYYSLISNIASAILKKLLLLSMSSIDRDSNKKLYKKSLGSLSTYQRRRPIFRTPLRAYSNKINLKLGSL